MNITLSPHASDILTGLALPEESGAATLDWILGAYEAMRLSCRPNFSTDEWTYICGVIQEVDERDRLGTPIAFHRDEALAQGLGLPEEAVLGIEERLRQLTIPERASVRDVVRRYWAISSEDAPEIEEILQG